MAFMTQEGAIKTVLVADETPYSRDMLAFLLTEEGHHVHLAADIDEASRLLAEHGQSLDLVILDIEPREDGEIDLPAPLRPGGPADQVPLLVVTGARSGSGASHERIDATVHRTVATERILFAVNCLLYPQDEVTRDAGRRLVRFPVNYRRQDAVIAEAFNLSRGGIFLTVEDDSLPPVGTPVRLRLDHPGEGVVEVDGEVMWRNTGASMQRSHPRGIGVRFLRVSPALERILALR